MDLSFRIFVVGGPILMRLVFWNNDLAKLFD